MTQDRGLWSVKGIDDRARMAAREAARHRGQSLGDYLNELLTEPALGPAMHEPRPQPTPTVRRPTAQAAPPTQPVQQAPEPARAALAPADALKALARRIEAIEARSTLAITGMDQSVVGLVRRLEDAEHGQNAVIGHVDTLLEDVRGTFEQLQGRIRQLEADDTPRRTADSLRTIEDALGKLAAHVHEENGLAQAEADAIRGRVEAGFSELGERVENMEVRVEQTLSEAARRVEKAVEQAEQRTVGSTRHISERVSALEEKVATRLDRMDQVADRMDGVEADVSGALSSMEGLLTRIQDRLNRAEAGTDSALKGLESTFDALDRRIEAVASQVGPQMAQTLKTQFEARFETLAGTLQDSITRARAELAAEIERTARLVDPAKLNAVQDSMQGLETRMAQSQAVQNQTLDAFATQIRQTGEGMERRLRAVEARDEAVLSEAARAEVGKLAAAIDARLDTLDAREASAIGEVGRQVEGLADRLEARINDSEHRSARAIEQVGEQVAGVVHRLKSRQDEAVRTLSERMEQQTRTQDARLSDTLERMSQRLEAATAEARQTVSPVSRAISGLVARIEALEDFNTPPAVPGATAASAPVVAPARAASPVAPAPAAVSGPAPASVPPAAKAPAEAPASAAAQEDFEPGLAYIRAEVERHAALLAQQGTQPPAPPALPPEPEFDAAVKGFARDPLEELGGADTHGAHEVRDSDVFGPEPHKVSPPPAGPAFPLPEPPLPPLAEAEAKLAEQDYLACARRAAIAAAANENRGKTARPEKDERATRSAASAPSAVRERPEKAAGMSRTPVIAAASALALAAAGGAGYYYYSRGKTEPAIVTAVASVPSDTVAAPVQMAEDDFVFASDPASSEETDALLFDPASDEAPVPGMPGDGSTEAAAASKAPVNTPETVPAKTQAAPASAATPAPGKPAQAQPTTRAQAAPATIVPAASTPAPARVAPTPTPVRAVTLESAARAGNAIALLQLGEARLAAGANGEGADLVMEAARAGQPAAQYRLAKLYERGTGVEGDIAEARRWTERAAEGGNVKAMHDLAVYYAEGEGGAQSYASAASWFRKAAEYGVVDSQFNLALMYEQGLGVSPDLTEALYWFEVAGSGGDASALDRVREIRRRTSLETAQQAQRRAATFTPTPPDAPANGTFPKQAWEASAAAAGAALSAPGAAASGVSVVEVQQLLTALGYDPGATDGQIGGRTRTAIAQFQRDRGLPANGEIDGVLMIALRNAAQANVG